jgi:hypothetical protein
VLISNISQAQISFNKHIRASSIASACGINEELILNNQIFYGGLGLHKTNKTLLGFDKKYKNNIASSGYIKINNYQIWSEYNLVAAIATRVHLTSQTYLQLGISPELEWISTHNTDPYREIYEDPVFQNQTQNQLITNIHAGISLQSTKFFIDIAGNRLVSLAIKGDKKYKQNPHFIINGGMDMPIYKDWNIKPTVSFIWTDNLYILDAGAESKYKEYISLSYDIIINNGYQNGIAHKIMLNLRTLERLKIRVGYVFGNSLVYKISQGTYQVGLQYQLKKSTNNNPKNL